MARERAIDLTALVEGARPEQGRVPTPRFPSWEDLGLQGTPTAAAAADVLAAPATRRRDLRAGGTAPVAAETRWVSPLEHADERYDSGYDSRYDDRYDDRAPHAQRYGYVEEQVPAQDWYGDDAYAHLPAPARTPRAAAHELPHELPLPADAEADLPYEEAPRRQRPPVLTWLLVAAALVLTGMVGYLLGASGPAAELASARSALSSAQQAQQSAEQQLAAAQQAQATVQDAAQDATAAGSASLDAAQEPAKAVASATAKASAKASAAPSASAQPATADAAGVSPGSGSAEAPAASKAPSKAPSSDEGTGSSSGSGSAGSEDSGSIGTDPAAPAADPVG